MFSKVAELTLIEVIMMMSILAMIGAMTVPQFVAAADEASANAKWEASIAAKNSRMTLSEQTGEKPTIIALADHAGGKPVASGILVEVDGGVHVIPTYTNSICNEPTQNINDKVACVGSI